MPIYRCIRIQMLDRPGALSAVSASLAAHGVDIVRLDVVSHEDGTVVDDLLLAAESPGSFGAAVGGFLPDVTVRTFEGLPGDPTLEMGLGLEAVAAAPDGPAAVGAAAAHGLALGRGDVAAVLHATSNGALIADAAVTPLPDIGPDEPFVGRTVLRRLAPVAFPVSSRWAPAAIQSALGAAWVALVPMGEFRLLLVARQSNVAFYRGELERLAVYASAAGRIFGHVAGGSREASLPAGAEADPPPRSVTLDDRLAVAQSGA